MKKFLIIFGTRPEAIKMAPLVHSLSRYANSNPNKLSVKVCITAQHRQLLDQVLDVFEIEPHYDLDIMQDNQDLFHLSSRILLKVKEVLNDFEPDLVFVHGDTSTSFFAALASFYKQIKVAHVEAGLRTNDIYSPWPEEANRQLTSRLTDFHFAPTLNSKNNLIAENIFEKDIFISGNTVIDALLFAQNKIKKDHELQEKIENEINIDFRVKGSKYILVTGHRRENFGKSFVNICKALKDIASLNKEFKIIYPMHMNPNVVEPVTEMLGSVDNIYLIKPLEYLSFVFLMDNSYLILTDSGGIQEEAPSLGKPVLVMRENTERPEALEHGTVKLVGTNRNKIADNVQELIDNQGLYLDMSAATNPYGDGTASEKILEILIKAYEL